MGHSPRFTVWAGVKCDDGDFDEDILSKLPREYHTKPPIEYVDAAVGAAIDEPILLDDPGDFEDDDDWDGDLDFDEIVDSEVLKGLSGLPIEVLVQSGEDIGLGVILRQVDWDDGVVNFAALIGSDQIPNTAQTLRAWFLGMGFPAESLGVWCHCDIDL